MDLEQLDDQLTGSISSSSSPAWMYSPVSPPSSAVTSPLQFPIIRGAFLLRQPPKPLDWKWRCHFCGRLWRLATTRRCLRDGHYFCKAARIPKIPKIPRVPKSPVSSEPPQLARPQRSTSPPFFCPLPPHFLDLSCFLRPSPRQEFPQPAATVQGTSPRQEISRSAIAIANIAGRESSFLEEAGTANLADPHNIPSKPEPASDPVPLSSPLQRPPSTSISCTSLGDDTPAPRSHRTPLPTQRTPLQTGRFGPVARQTKLLTARGSMFARRDHISKRDKELNRRGQYFCEGIFDRPGWKNFNDWRRRVLQRKQMDEEGEEDRNDKAQVERNRKRKRDGDDGGRNCLINCDFPMDCLIKKRKLDGPKDGYEKDEDKHESEDYDKDEDEDDEDEDDEDEDDEDDEDKDEDEDEDEDEYEDEYEDEDEWVDDDGDWEALHDYFNR